MDTTDILVPGELVKVEPERETPRVGEPIDYERAYMALCKALGREMISSSALYFVVCSVKTEAGPEAAREAALLMGFTRTKSTHDFMG